jgi:hypothetical protein
MAEKTKQIKLKPKVIKRKSLTTLMHEQRVTVKDIQRIVVKVQEI